MAQMFQFSQYEPKLLGADLKTGRPREKRPPSSGEAVVFPRLGPSVFRSLTCYIGRGSQVSSPAPIVNLASALLVWGHATVALADATPHNAAPNSSAAPNSDAAPSDSVLERTQQPQVIPPRLLATAEALYPQDALRARIEGTVLLGLLVSSDGKVEEANVIDGPSPSLNAAARDAALRFVFTPAMVAGQPKAARLRFAYEFRLPPLKDETAAPLSPDVPQLEPSEAPDPEPHSPGPMRAPTSSSAAEPSAGETDVTIRGYREGSRLQRSAAAVTVVELARAKRESSDMGTVLSRAEGVSVQQVGGLGSQARFNLGGFDDTQVRFFIDGIPLEYQGFALGIQNVPLNLVERVDVYKGVVPIQFGADSLGGAFNLVTDRATAGLRATASYQGGSFDTHRATASARYLDTTTGFFFKGEGFFDSADNDYTVDVKMGDRTGQTLERRVRRFHDAYAAQGGNLELGIVNSTWARRLLVRAFASSYEKELQHNASMTVPYGEAAFGGYSSGLSLRHEYDMGLGLSTSLVVGYAYDRSDFVDDPRDCIYNWLGECRPQRRDTSGELRASATEQTLWDHTGYARWNLRWEMALGHQLALSTAPTFFTRTGKDHLLQAADAFMPLSGKRDMFKWISGVEYRATDSNEQLENVLFAKSYLNTAQSEELLSKTVSVDRSVQGLHWGVGDGFRHAFTEWALAKLSYEYSVRLPEPREVFGNGAQIGENLDLQPERSHNLNLTFLVDDLETRWGTVNASLTGFYRDARDLVLLLGRSEIFFYDNVFRARVKGIEAAAAWLAPNEFFELGANLTYQDLRNHAEEGPFATFEGDRIPNKPYLFANGRARLQKEGLAAPSDELSFTWYTRYVHRFFRTWESIGSEEERPVIDSQLVHSAVVTYSDSVANGRDISFSLEGQNLADSKVFDFYGVQRQGRTIFFKTVLTY